MILLVAKIYNIQEKTNELPHVTDKLNQIKTPLVHTVVQYRAMICIGSKYICRHNIASP